MQQTNGHAKPSQIVNISDLARRSGWSRATVRARLRQGWHPDDLLPVKAPEIRQEKRDVASPAIPAARPLATTPVDLVKLRHAIQDWAKLHQEVERMRTGKAPWNPRVPFLITAVAFLVFLAYAAV